ncbi:MAG: cysteine synthase CysM [Saprospiraceae bacterium]
MRLAEIIGNTPLIETNLSVNSKVRIFAKLEGNNPGGSVKDRAALGMIQCAIKRGELSKGSKIVEATSGNTGIALALIGSQLGIKVTLIMPDSATIERQKTMRAYGATLILTPAAKSITYSRDLARDMANNQGYVMLNQFGNEDNPGMHYKTTGPEIWKDTKGKITHFVSAMGTTGTIMGVSKYLKEQNQDITIVGCHPKDGSKIPGIRKWEPEHLPTFYDVNRVDQISYVSAENAKIMARTMASAEGIFAGMSSGGAMHAAVQLSKEIKEGIIVTIVCDRGDRYLSSDLYQ